MREAGDEGFPISRSIHLYLIVHGNVFVPAHSKALDNICSGEIGEPIIRLVLLEHIGKDIRVVLECRCPLYSCDVFREVVWEESSPVSILFE